MSPRRKAIKKRRLLVSQTISRLLGEPRTKRRRQRGFGNLTTVSFSSLFSSFLSASTISTTQIINATAEMNGSISNE